MIDVDWLAARGVLEHAWELLDVLGLNDLAKSIAEVILELDETRRLVGVEGAPF